MWVPGHHGRTGVHLQLRLHILRRMRRRDGASLSQLRRRVGGSKVAAYDSFVANAGTYEVADSTLTIHPVVARSPNFMSGGSDKYRFRVSGDTLWLSNALKFFPGLSPAVRPPTT